MIDPQKKIQIIGLKYKLWLDRMSVTGKPNDYINKVKHTFPNTELIFSLFRSWKPGLLE